ncbi:MAG: hypothetical protein ACT4OS_04860 [Acidimicrobiales bacterium]
MSIFEVHAVGRAVRVGLFSSPGGRACGSLEFDLDSAWRDDQLRLLRRWASQNTPLTLVSGKDHQVSLTDEAALVAEALGR